MKKILAWVMLLTLVVGLFAGCGNQNKPTEPSTTVSQGNIEGINDALNYLKAMYPTTDEPTPTPRNYSRMNLVRIAGIPYNVVWSTSLSEEYLQVVDNGDGTATIQVIMNPAEDTLYQLTATISDDAGNSVSHSWDMLLTKAIDMGQVVDEAYALANGEVLPYEATLTGRLISIDTVYDPDYQNITVTMVVEGKEDKPIKCYRLKGDGCANLAVGNIITVTGTIKNYNGTIEFDAGCILEAVEQGDAVEAPTDPGEILKAAYALKSGAALPYPATLTGKVTQIDAPYDANYGNISVVIVVEGYSKYPILCYRLKGSGVDQVAIGDTLTVTGIIKNYNGTIEYDTGCKLLERVSGGNVAKTESYDTAQILADAKKLKTGQKLDYYANLTGKVTGLDTPYDKEYGNLSVYITVNGTQLLCYRLKSGSADASKIAVGDTITVRGIIENYKGALQFGSGSTVNDRVSGGGTAKPESSNAAQILADAKALATGAKLSYYANLTGKVVSIDTPYDKEYKNISVYIDVDGTQMLCYRLKTGKADASKIAVGDTITVRGVIENYKGALQFGTGSTLSKRVSGGGTAKPESSNAEQILADAAALATGGKLDYYATLTGKVVEIDTPYDKGYGNISVVIDVDGTQLLCYRLKTGKADASKIAVGDTITVRGVIENYKGEIQFGNGCTLSKRVSGGGTAKPESSDAAAILADAAALASGEKLGYYANLTGVVTSIKTPYDGNYGNVTLYIDVDGTNLYCYRMKSGAADASKVKVGDTITVRGVIENYKGEIQFGTGCTVEKLVPGSDEPETPTTEPTVSGDAVAVVVIYNPSSGKALSSNPSRDGSYYLGGVDVTVNGSAVTGYGATEQWNLIDNGDGTYSFSYNGKNLAMGTQYSSTPLGDVNDDWKVIDAGNGLYYIENTVRTNNRLQWRAETYNYFSCYHSNNTGDAYKFAFYVISGSLPFGGNTEPEVTEPETTEPTTTEPGASEPSGDTVVVIYNPSSGKALSSNPSRDGSYYLGGVDVTVNGTTVTGFGATEQWKLINNGDGTYSFSYNGKNLAMGTQYSSTPLGDVNDDWKVIDAGNGLYYIENTVRTNNRLQWRAETYNYFSCYHSNNTGDAYKFAFYVISGSLPFGGNTEPEVTEPETTEPTTTEPGASEPSGDTVVVIYNPSSGKALSSNPSRDGSYYLGGVDVTVNGTTVTGFGATEQWKLINNGDGTYSFSYNGKNLAMGTQYSSTPLGDVNDDWKVIDAGNGLYYIENTVRTNNRLQWRAETYNYFSCYHSNNTGDAYKFAFYVISGKLPFGGTTEPEVTEPVTTEPTTTEPETTEPGVAGEAYYKITSAAEFTSGKYVMVVSTGYAPGVHENGWISAVQPVISGDTVTDTAGAVWTLTVSGNSVIMVDANGADIAPKGGNNNGVITGKNYQWTWSFSDGTFRFAGVGGDTVMLASNTTTGSNGGFNRFRGYKTATVNGNNAASYPSTFTLYKLGEGVIDPDVTEPEVTQPEVTEPETTQPSGDTVVVIYNPSSGKALSSNPSRDGSYYLGGVDVTVNGSAVTGYGATEQWNLIDNGDGTYSFSYNGKNLAMGTQYSSTPLGDVNDDWKVIDAGNGLYYIENTVRTNNRLQWRAETYNYFSCYHSNNTGDAYKFAFYVISGSLPFGGNTEPEVTEPETTEPTTTEPGASEPSGDTVVVIYNPSSGKALSSNPSRDGSYYLGGVDVTVNGTTVTGFGATEQWKLINNGDGTYSFSYNGKNLAMGTQYSSTPLGDVNDDWKVIDAGNGLYYIENTVRTNNRLQWRAETYNYFSCYHSNNTGDAYKFAFYVISGSLPFGGNTEPEVTEPEVTEPETTEPETTEPETTEPETTQPENPVVGGSADFASITTTNANGDSSYTKTFTTANGWTVEYSAIQTGGPAGCSNPQFAVIGPNNTYKAVCLNGKTSAPGKLTSPTLTTGISKLTIQYTKMFTDTALSVTVTVKDAAGNVYTHVVEKLAIDKNEKYVVYTDVWTLDTPVAGEFTIEVVNNCPTAQNSNKDRFTILDLSWEGAAAAHTHEYTATTTATCTAAGVTTYTCDCGDSYTEEVEKLGHIDENLDVECDREGCTSKVAPPADSVLSTYTANCLGSKLSVSNKYYVEGTIAEVLDARNGIFLIDDGTGEKFYFRLPKDADGVSHANWAIKLVLGDKVKVYGEVKKYTTSSAPNGQYWPSISGGVVTIIEQHPHDFTAIPATCSEPAFCACGQSYGEPLGCADTNGDDLCDDCGRNVKYIYEYVEIRTDNNSGVIDTTAGTYTWGNSNFDVQVVKGTSSQLYSTAKDHMRVYKGNQFVLANKNGIAVKTITVYLTNATQVTNFEKFLTGYTYTKDAENFTVTIEINSAETLTLNNTGSTTQIKGVEFGYEKPNA